MPLILPGNVASATASTTYDVDNSCRFNKADNAYHSKSLGTPTDADKFTISFWMKLGLVSSTVRTIFNIAVSGGANTFMQLTAADLMVFGRYDSGYQGNLTTTQVFRDPSAWYSIIVVYDSGNATAGNRMRLYVNGTEVTSFGTDTNPDQDLDSSNVSGATFFVGAYGDDDEEFDGYLAEFCFIDGLALTPSSFGEFNEDTPTVFQPIDVSGLTFGTNGFYLDFEASDNLGNDANGGTDLTESNLDATDQATDTPTNNFATMNPIAIDPDSTFTFTEGNLEYATSSSTRGYWVSTIAVSTGKWYFEYKCTNNQSRTCVGIAGAPTKGNNDPESGTHDNVTVYTTINGKISYNSNGGTDNYYNTATGSDDIIIGCALDLTSATNTLAFSIDGAWVTGDGTTDTDFTNVLLNDDFTNVASTVNGVYHFIAGDDGGDQDIDGQVNFGNPPFSISSGNADADGYGNFEYAVPSGYYALCTKNLAEYG